MLHRPLAPILFAAGAGWLLGLQPSDARACGCFAPPDPATPVIQAGERIVFAVEEGQVVAHIQIQFQGEASEFAWILPLPSMPTLELGSEELFAQLEATTQPTFVVNNTGFCGGGGFGCAGDQALFAPANEVGKMGPPVAVKIASAGPYDYAVLRADEKQPMLDWLTANHFFVPAGTDGAVDPYIHPGAFLLALKLRAGERTGDLQPVIVRYPSDLPMIPIILTSVAAVPDMGILVWVLGEARAVPRNYEHVLINDAQIDWTGEAKNYQAVVGRAIDESESGHAFVTEYAGSTTPMVGVLDPAGRFSHRAQLEAEHDAAAFVFGTYADGFTPQSVRSIMERTFPIPQAALAAGVSAESYYGDLGTSIRRWDRLAQFDPVALTAELWERVAAPILSAAKLFRDHSKMTRLFTVLSPEEMTEDPVFAFNTSLPDVSNLHSATMENLCDSNPGFRFVLPDGRSFLLDQQSDWSARNRPQDPDAARIEILREEGEPEVQVDNREALADLSDQESQQGCSSVHRDHDHGGLDLMLIFAAMLISRGTRKRRLSR